MEAYWVKHPIRHSMLRWDIKRHTDSNIQSAFDVLCPFHKFFELLQLVHQLIELLQLRLVRVER